MAEIARFTAEAPRRGSLDVPADNGMADMLASVAQVSGQLANKLGNWADRRRIAEGEENGPADDRRVEMPGVEFAFNGKSAATTVSKSAAATSPSGDDLAAHLTDPSRLPHLQGIRPEFRSSLAAMISAAPESLRNDIKLMSGYRSTERQSQLFTAAVAKYGSEQAARKWVAPPGRSRHNHGEAFDLQYGSDAAKQWVHQNAATFGLRFPMAYEPWHIELAGARGNIAPDPTTTASTPPTPAAPSGISITLTGTAGAVPQVKAGTLYGDAYNRAALETHINRLDTAMREQMGALALEHDGDPSGLISSLDALRAGYVKDLPPAAAALIDQSFARQKFSLSRQAVDKFNQNLESANMAAFEENISARTSSAYRLAAKAGLDAAADQAIAGELGALTTQIDASPLTPLQKSRYKADAVSGVMSARVLGGFEAQKDPAARAAYVQKFQADWQAGEGLSARMDAKTYDRINGELIRGVQADAVAANKRDNALDQSLKSQIATLKKGWPVPEANRAFLKNEVAKTDDAQLAANLDFFDGLADWQKAHVAAKPEVIDAQITAMQAKIQKEGASEAALTTLDVMEGLRDQMKKGLADDPLTWANRAGVAQVEPLDFSDSARLAASLTERVADAGAVAQHYGIEPKYFTGAETDGLKKMLKQTPLALPSIVSSLSAGLGSATPQALGEISKEAPLLAHVAGLTSATGNQRPAVEIAEVLDRRNQPGYKSVLPPAAKLQSAAAAQIGPALIALPGTLSGTMETAAALFEARALSRGIDMDQFDQPGSPARELYLDAVDEALGATIRDGTKFGGLTDVNGLPTVAPPAIEADALGSMISNLSADDLIFQGAIGTANGLPIRATDLRGGQLVMTAQGRYRIALGDVAGGDPRYVPAADGGYFELDVGMLKRTQDARGYPTMLRRWQFERNSRYTR